MRRTVGVISVLVTTLMGPVLPSSAQDEPPRGPCNRGTMHAHETVPHETEGNMVAHENIPHCPEH